MKAKTKLMLYMLSWQAEKVMSPSFRNLTEGFESWAYRSGFLRQIQRLEAEGFLERHPEAGVKDPFLRLTEAGLSVAKGGRDPEKLWKRKWDGCWRMFLFDIPREEAALRQRMLKALRGSGCGCLQGSVWVACDLPKALRPFTKPSAANPSSLMVIETRKTPKLTSENIVEEAWDFSRIEDLYFKLVTHLKQFPAAGDADMLYQWAETEYALWMDICSTDPFLPEALWPVGYDGPRAVTFRREVLAQAADRAVTLFDS
jgi:DNA-binding transcriptional regulator PaaX